MATREPPQEVHIFGRMKPGHFLGIGAVGAVHFHLAVQPCNITWYHAAFRIHLQTKRKRGAKKKKEEQVSSQKRKTEPPLSSRGYRRLKSSGARASTGAASSGGLARSNSGPCRLDRRACRNRNTMHTHTCQAAVPIRRGWNKMTGHHRN